MGTGCFFRRICELRSRFSAAPLPVFYSMNLYLLLFQRVTATQVPCGTRRQVFVKHRVSCLG